jgi:hypothetical protein
MKRNSILGFCFLFALGSIHLQEAKGQLQQADSSLKYITGEGTFLSLGKAEGTRLNLLTTIQSGFQYTHIDSSSNPNSNRLSLNLVRIAFSASTRKDKITVGIVTDLTGVTPILEGWVGFSIFKRRAKLIVGQKQTHTNNRLAMADERYAQTMGQTLGGKSNDGTTYGGVMQSFVGSTREGGIFLESNFSLNSCRIYPSVSLTTGEGQNFFSAQPNVGFKYGGRIDIMPLGDFIKNNAFIAHDIYREHKPKLAFGFAASFNAKASSPIGSDNAATLGIYNKSGATDFADYRKIAADFIFKYNGFALVGEYINGTVTGKELYTNSSGTKKLTTDTASFFYNIGSAFNLQSSYVFANGWAVDGRFSMVTPEFDLTNSLIHRQKWYTLGLNRFIKNNAVKIGMNVTSIENSTPLISAKKWIANFAIQILM